MKRVLLCTVLAGLACVKDHPCRDNTILVTIDFADNRDRIDGVALKYSLDDAPLADLKPIARRPGVDRDGLELEVKNYASHKKLILQYAPSKAGEVVGPWQESAVRIKPGCTTIDLVVALVERDGAVTEVAAVSVDGSSASDDGIDLVIADTGPDALISEDAVVDVSTIMPDVRGIDSAIKPDSLPVPEMDVALEGTPHEDGPVPVVGADVPLDFAQGLVLDGASIVPIDGSGDTLPEIGPDVQSIDGASDTTLDAPQDIVDHCAGAYGQSCNRCGGTIQCDGTCAPGEPANYGISCGSCGGRILCNGTCSEGTPGNLGTACNGCGGTIQCDGSCSPGPADWGYPCNCTGTVACDGTCTMSGPPDYNTDPNHCGGCHQACSNNNAIPACAAGECVSQCADAGLGKWVDCNGDLRGDGCETNVGTDNTNCGRCGNVCTGRTDNDSGQCLWGTSDYTCFNCDGGRVPTGRLNCDHDPSNGCETNIWADPKNCGGCGIACPSGQTCIRPGVCGGE